MYVDDSYVVPLDVEISVEVKPRSLSGVLLSVFNHGAGPPGGDFLVLQLVNGQVSTYTVHWLVLRPTQLPLLSGVGNKCVIV